MHHSILSTLILLLCATLCPAAERMALVIGNNAYTLAKPLANPVRDAGVIGDQLKQGGWKVTPVTDAGVLALRKALREFCEAAKGADAAMVFYAGHGIEVKGKNYLLPVDAKLSDEAGEDALPVETLGLDEMLQSLGGSGARLKIVVLDSCRDNPLSRSWLSGRSSGGGLAVVAEKAMAEGTMLVFSTAPGMVASDGVGKNSPFTTALSARMGKGGAVSDIFIDASLAMGTKQQAWIRFDGSGHSLAAFRAFPLFPGGGGAAPAVTLVPSAPAADANKFAGRWKVTEEVDAAHGGFRIEWKYTFSENDGRIHVTGRKALVNGKEPTGGEKVAWAEGDLKRWNESGNERSGEVIETNHRATQIRSQWTLKFAPDKNSFVGSNMENGKIVGRLRGLRDD